MCTQKHWLGYFADAIRYVGGIKFLHRRLHESAKEQFKRLYGKTPNANAAPEWIEQLCDAM